ncbi:hypothetical protein AKJ38_01340 [candidate division MSBL1 archaeon SCGC-AAA259I14]|uniref:Cation:proton antiporter n=1 Tax=candidate division MSBL1 archaeon SCGC-AAA259I14 TaxID=1698268 RepID=A0A133UT73_9EURY|nr:hypothetical protein AKJ38_01340 [candidate division MSBL1 archaeon SCGC-AAA259I14]
MIALHYPVAIILFLVGIYCLLFRRNLIKMVIGLELLTDGVHLFLISVGYKTLAEGSIPIAPILTSNVKDFASRAVDPLPQVLVLTSIVIDISIVALALSLVIYIYSEYGTLNPYKIRELRG